MRKGFARAPAGLLVSLVVGTLPFAVAELVVVLVNRQMRQYTLIEAESRARILLDRNLATLTYFTRSLKPCLFTWTEPSRTEDYFDPTWTSSTYAIREIDACFQSLSPADYYYEAAVNVRSLRNEADSFERAFIEETSADPALVERSVIRILDGPPLSPCVAAK